MRVLVVTHYFPEHGGGVEIAAHHIAAGLAHRGFTIEWIASREESVKTSEAPGAHAVHALNVTERWFGIPYPLWGPSAYRALASAVRRSDILHLHDTLYAGNLVAFLTAKRLGKPVLITQHLAHVPYKNPLLSGTMTVANHLVAAKVIARSSRTVFYSKTTERYFRRLIPKGFPLSWIPNGLDLEMYRQRSADERRALRAELGWPGNRPIILFVGRFVEKKGLAILASLVASFPEASWVFAGWGPTDPSRWGAQNVLVAGRCSRREVARLYQAADLLVLPSVGEGFPLVVQESMACGTPVAVSRETADAYPGLGPVVWSAEPSVGGFTALLRELLANPSVLETRRRETALFAAREWNWAVCVRQYEGLIRNILRPELPIDVAR